MFTSHLIHGIHSSPPLIDLVVRIANIDHRAFHPAEDSKDNGIQVLGFIHHDVVHLGPWSGKCPEFEIAIMAKRQTRSLVPHCIPDRLSVSYGLKREVRKLILRKSCKASKALEVITSWLVLIALQKALHRIEEDRAVGTLRQRQPGTEGERFRHGERGPNHIGRECSHQLPLREAKAPPDSAKGDGMACRTSHLFRKSRPCVLGDASIEGQIKAALRAAPRKQLKRARLSCTGIRVDTQTFSLQEHFPSLFLLCYR